MDINQILTDVKSHYKEKKYSKAKALLKSYNLIELEDHTIFDDLDNSSIVLDLGGWQGNFSQYIYDRYGATVYTVEPNEKFYNNMKERFRGNDKIKLFKCAIGGKTEIVKFYPSPEDFPGQEKGSSLLSSSPYVDESIFIEVQKYSLADFVKEINVEKIDLIKMDIEGAEKELFDDPSTKYVMDICRSFTIELHYITKISDVPMISKEDILKIINALQNRGFAFLDFSRDVQYIDCLFYKK